MTKHTGHKTVFATLYLTLVAYSCHADDLEYCMKDCAATLKACHANVNVAVKSQLIDCSPANDNPQNLKKLHK